MRGTLHLIASDDLASFVAAAPTRGVATTAAWLKYFEVTKDELDTIFRTVDATLGGEPRTRAELIDAVARRDRPARPCREAPVGMGLVPEAFGGVVGRSSSDPTGGGTSRSSTRRTGSGSR